MTLPSFEVFDEMFVGCVTIAIVSYAISVSIAKAFAKKHKQKVDANQVSTPVYAKKSSRYIQLRALWQIIWII